MTACDRFESEGLTRFVAGEPLDAHFENCADCRAARASYQAVALALEQAREAYAPPGDWEAKVWAKIQRKEGARQRPRWPALLGFGATVAAAALVFVTSAGGPAALVVAANDIAPGSGQVVRAVASARGDVRAASPGNVWHISMKAPRGKARELRVYRGTNELVFQCTTSAACAHSKDGLEAWVPLDRVGTYRYVAIAADKAVPPATGNLDTDYAAALRSGTATESSAPSEFVEVR
jgi:hypothetical protein